MTLNVGKPHFMCRGKNTANKIFTFKNLVMKNSKPKTKNTWGLLKTAEWTVKVTLKNYVKNPHKK